MNIGLFDKLKAPFHPAQVSFSPGTVTANGKVLALFYADYRAYQDRLDQVCGVEWSVTYTPWGDRIICHLTIFGVTRSSTGEFSSAANRSGTAGASAEAQAFKRAASMFGLGRYLYEFPPTWLDIESERQFSEESLARLRAMVVAHYERATGNKVDLDDKSGFLEPFSVENDVADGLRKQLARIGQDMYGDRWPSVLARNVKRITCGATSDPQEMTLEQVGDLIRGIKALRTK